jgi:hypothetical protein
MVLWLVAAIGLVVAAILLLGYGLMRAAARGDRQQSRPHTAVARVRAARASRPTGGALRAYGGPRLGAGAARPHPQGLHPRMRARGSRH